MKSNYYLEFMPMIQMMMRIIIFWEKMVFKQKAQSSKMK